VRISSQVLEAEASFAPAHHFLLSYEPLTWLERALEDRIGWLWMTPLEPRFDPLRGNARFREMVGRHGLRSES